MRRAGLIFTQTNVSTVVTGNYIDNCFIEWGNEHDATPEFNNEFSFGGLNIVGNVFIASNKSSAFRWIVVKPYGTGHFLNGFSMTGNSFRVFNATVDRVEMYETPPARTTATIPASSICWRLATREFTSPSGSDGDEAGPEAGDTAGPSASASLGGLLLKGSFTDRLHCQRAMRRSLRRVRDRVWRS